MALQGVKRGLSEGKEGGLGTEAEPNSEALPQGARAGGSLFSALGLCRDLCRWEHIGQ